MADEKAETVAFEPKADVNKVTMAVQGYGLVEIDGHYETSDPLLIAALDGAEGVKRSTGAAHSKKKED
jgi:hypothetical protein